MHLWRDEGDATVKSVWVKFTRVNFRESLFTADRRRYCCIHAARQVAYENSSGPTCLPSFARISARHVECVAGRPPTVQCTEYMHHP